MAGFVKVATVDEIPEGSFKAFKTKHHKFLVAHITDGFFAVADECSHDAAPISEGELYGDDIVCPRHGARFDLTTGEVKAPPAVAPIDSYEVKIDGSDILVLLD
ncbi:MAG: non-heme iron oxygenase ferredoxin subunit [Candidatus Zixiibacteriota bacterium]